jgi:outer membrane protein assembly factor BamB
MIETDWKANPPKELWRQPAGEGYSSFSVGGGRAYTIEQRYENEVVACYDIATGREVWTHSYPAYFRESLGGDGPRSTPTLDGVFVYALGAEGDLRCLAAADGTLVWKREILKEFGAQNLQWAMSASPLIEGDKVIVTNSGTPGPSILAFDKRTGANVWQNDVGQQAYSSPVPAVLAGRRQILNLAGRHLNGIDIENGRLLWQFPFATSILISVANPLVLSGDRVFVSAGYGTGCAMVQVSETDGTWSAKELWSNVRMKNKFSSSVVVDGFIYGLDEDILACLDADTGDRKWKGGRYGYGSVLAVGRHLLVLAEDGTLALVKATPERHEELASVRIIEDDKVWNNHVLVGGILLARNHREMVCYDLRPAARRMARP